MLTLDTWEVSTSSIEGPKREGERERERERERGHFIKINHNNDNDTIIIQCMDHTD